LRLFLNSAFLSGGWVLSEKRTYRITIELDPDTYRKLVDKALSEGYSIIADYVIHVIKNSLAVPAPSTTQASLDDFYTRLKPRIERMIQDQLNEFMKLISDIRSKVADLYDKYDQLSQMIKSIAEKENLLKQQSEVKRKTGIERLREEKVLFESSLPAKINREKFFAYLEREGAVILKLAKERVAVDREFWNYFKNKIFEELSTDDEEELKNILGSKGYELFKRIRDDLLIFFDKKKMKWVAVDKNISLK